MKHPSTLYKKLVRGVLLLAFIAVALILGNRLGILSHSVKNAGLVILLFVCNMALALGARHAIERAVWPESWKRGGAAGLLVLCFAALLFADSDITDLIIGEKGDPVDEATAQLAAAATWVGAYVVAWKPFLRRKENRYISACVSLTLGCIAVALFFVSLYSNALLGVVGWKVEFVRFALASVAFASSISAFIVQWDTREVRRRKEEVERLVADRVEIRYFDPADDLDEAERFAPVGVRLEPGNENTFEAWTAGRDAMCEALVRATHFYGAYYQGRLAGFLLAERKGERRPYQISRYTFFHWLYKRIHRELHGSEAVWFEEAKSEVVSSVTPVPTAEILLFATDPELMGRGIGTKLLQTFESDYKGERVVAAVDGATDTAFFDRHGYVEAGSKTVSEALRPGDTEIRCRVFMKAIPAPDETGESPEKKAKDAERLLGEMRLRFRH